MKKLTFIFSVILLIACPVLAKTPEERGLEIALEVQRRDDGWKTEKATLKMVLRNKQGDKSVRRLRRESFEVNEPGFGDKGLTIFDAPKDIEGTAFLSHTRTLEPDDQWLYLPALKRVKRISSANKSGSFVGSEFAYEDLLSQEAEKYQHKFLKEENFAGLSCYVLERSPKYKYSGYTRQKVWYDKVEYRPMKIEFYDRKDTLLKTLEYKKYRRYLNKYWRPDAMLMKNYQTKKATYLIFNKWELGVDLKESQFTPVRLKNIR